MGNQWKMMKKNFYCRVKVVRNVARFTNLGMRSECQWRKKSGHVRVDSADFRITSLRGITIRDDRRRPEVNRWI